MYIQQQNNSSFQGLYLYEKKSVNSLIRAHIDALKAITLNNQIKVQTYSCKNKEMLIVPESKDTFIKEIFDKYSFPYMPKMVDNTELKIRHPKELYAKYFQKVEEKSAKPKKTKAAKTAETKQTTATDAKLKVGNSKRKMPDFDDL